MSYICDVRLVGELTKDVEVKTSRQGKKYAILDMRTGKPLAKGWVFSQHRVVVFRTDLIDFLGKQTKGTWLKVFGELGYMNGGNSAQVVVDEGTGSVGLMFKDVWQPSQTMTDEEFEIHEKAPEVSKASAASSVKSSAQKPQEKPAMAELDADEVPF